MQARSESEYSESEEEEEEEEETEAEIPMQGVQEFTLPFSMAPSSPGPQVLRHRTVSIASNGPPKRTKRKRKRKSHYGLKEMWTRLKARAQRGWTYANDTFEWIALLLETPMEVVFHRLLLIVQWLLLRVKPPETSRNAHWFELPSAEERTGTRVSRQYISLVTELRRKFIISKERRMRIYKMILTGFLLTLVLVVSMQFVADVAEYNSHVRRTYQDPKGRGTIANLLYAPHFPAGGINPDVEWLLYSPLEAQGLPTYTYQARVPKLRKETLIRGYAEIATRRFGLVNISIDEMVQQMERDSARRGALLPQPCICAAHYGIPLNIILIRYSLQTDPETGDPGTDVIHFEPRATTYIRDSILGSVNQDPFVVPRRFKERVGHLISPLDWEVVQKWEDGVYASLDRKAYIVDMTNKPLTPSHEEGHAPPPPSLAEVYGDVRETVPQRNLHKVKVHNENPSEGPPLEITVTYSQFAMRSLDQLGEKKAAVWIKKPYSSCVARCISAVHSPSLR